MVYLVIDQTFQAQFTLDLVFIYILLRLVVFIICIVEIFVAAAQSPYYHHDVEMLRNVFIVQGSCGLFVVFVYTCAHVFE